MESSKPKEWRGGGGSSSFKCMVRRAVALCERRTVARVRRAPGLVAHYSGTVEHSAVPLAGGAGGGSRRPADGTAL